MDIRTKQTLIRRFFKEDKKVTIGDATFIRMNFINLATLDTGERVLLDHYDTINDVRVDGKLIAPALRPEKIPSPTQRTYTDAEKNEALRKAMGYGEKGRYTGD